MPGEGYGELAVRYTRRFHRRWIQGKDDDQLLGTPDLQSLADLGGSFDVIRQMRTFPFGARNLAVLFVALVAPILPLVTAAVPLPHLVKTVAHILLGGLPA